MFGAVVRMCRRSRARPIWRAGARHRDAARGGGLPEPRRWGTPDERYAYHYQYAHIRGERLLRGLPSLIRWRDSQ